MIFTGLYVSVITSKPGRMFASLFLQLALRGDPWNQSLFMYARAHSRALPIPWVAKCALGFDFDIMCDAR